MIKLTLRQMKIIRIIVFAFFSAAVLAYIIYCLGVNTAVVAKELTATVSDGEYRLEYIIPLVGDWLFTFSTLLPTGAILYLCYFKDCKVRADFLIIMAIVACTYLILSLFESFVWQAKAVFFLAEMLVFVPIAARSSIECVHQLKTRKKPM